MIRLVVWLAVCLLVALLLRRQPGFALAGVLMLRLLVPAVAANTFTGLPVTSPIGFHPATWLTLTLFVVMAVTAPRPLVLAVIKHRYVALICVVFIVGAGLTSVIAGSGGTRLLIDQIAAPVLIAFMILAVGRGARDRQLLQGTIVLAAVVQSIISFAQLATGSVLFFEDAYLRIYWFDPERNTRWMGTTDSPLLLSLLLTVAGALVLGYRSSILRFALLFLFTASSLVTQSRTGTGFMIVLLLVAIFLTRMSLLSRIASVVAATVAVIVVSSSGLAGGLTGRLEDDTGSSAARLSAFQFGLSEMQHYIFSGSGLGSSFDIARDAGLQTSLESSFLMYALDVGLILATLYFGMQLVLLLRYGLVSAEWAVLASLICLVSLNGSSALAFGNFTGMLSWATLALVMVGADNLRPEPSQGRVSALSRVRISRAS